MKACPRCQIPYPPDTVHCFVDGAELVAIRDPLVGTTIGGQYILEDLLGEGGMATVYRARYKLVDRRCAVKIMKPALASDASVRERFRREAKSVQSIAHPNVIEMFEQGETEDGTPYIAMEFLEGETLSSLIDQGAIPTVRAIPIMIQIARGIARAHDLGVVHRDLKPDNIFICRRDDGTDLVKILDFGIARSRADPRLTNDGELFGTPQYMAPERVMSGDAGPSVDLYAVGVIFFEMATARLPFEASDPSSFLIMQVKEPAPSPRSINRRVPEPVDALILGLLEKDPGARPVDAHRVEQDLMALARSLGAKAPPEPEADPSSSSPLPARTRSAIGIEPWRRRVGVFDQMMARAYGGRPPGDTVRTLAELRRLVEDGDATRTECAHQQRVLEDIDVRGREGRQRLGFAVDALGLDASKAKDDVRSALADLERWTGESAQAERGYADAHGELLTWEGRSARMEPYRQLVQAHRACADAVDLWLEARHGERSARAAVEGKERIVKDLEYQIAQLRSALANHEEGIDRARAAAQARLVELNGRSERLEHRLVQLATRFCEPLRARPDLGPLFHALEASAS
jgi:serine/threonine protein kinase